MEIKLANASKFKKAYSGMKGCMCGCLGKYFEGEKGIKRIYKKIIRIATLSPDIVAEFNADPEYVYLELKSGRCYAMWYEK
jgi:hypothetical protein